MYTGGKLDIEEEFHSILAMLSMHKSSLRLVYFIGIPYFEPRTLRCVAQWNIADGSRPSSRHRRGASAVRRSRPGLEKSDTPPQKQDECRIDESGQLVQC